MASEIEQEKRETLADIVADMREAGALMPAAYMRDLLNYADRIEAALKRERAAFDCECAGIAELAAKEEAARHKPGNAAAMREALKKVGNAAAWIAESCNDQQTATYMNDMIAIVQTASSAPARNCDVYPKRDDAGEAWNKTLDERTRDMVQRYPLTAMDMFIDWLLAYAEDGGAS